MQTDGRMNDTHSGMISVSSKSATGSSVARTTVPATAANEPKSASFILSGQKVQSCDCREVVAHGQLSASQLKLQTLPAGPYDWTSGQVCTGRLKQLGEEPEPSSYSLTVSQSFGNTRNRVQSP